VGGDFYGATALPDDRLAVFIGDIMGHGVGAAAAMAQLRTAVRAFLTVDADPVLVLQRLRALVRERSVTALATLAYGVVDRAAGTLELVTAGHLPPLIVRADGSVSPVAAPPLPALGGPACEAAATTVPFAEDDVLLMFTDGLVERRAEVIDTGIGRLAAAAGELIAPDLAVALRGIVPRVRAADADDDIAVIAVRARG
jgi:serine phosphatase RsbU (regulator of sigma subunit)